MITSTTLAPLSLRAAQKPHQCVVRLGLRLAVQIEPRVDRVRAAREPAFSCAVDRRQRRRRWRCRLWVARSRARWAARLCRRRLPAGDGGCSSVFGAAAAARLRSGAIDLTTPRHSLRLLLGKPPSLARVVPAHCFFLERTRFRQRHRLVDDRGRRRDDGGRRVASRRSTSLIGSSIFGRGSGSGTARSSRVGSSSLRHQHHERPELLECRPATRAGLARRRRDRCRRAPDR